MKTPILDLKNQNHIISAVSSNIFITTFMAKMKHVKDIYKTLYGISNGLDLKNANNTKGQEKVFLILIDLAFQSKQLADFV